MFRSGFKWLKQRIARWIICIGVVNNLIALKNRLKRCKHLKDYQTFKNIFYNKLKLFKAEAELSVLTIEHVARF